jgi:hypothetical protein
MINQHFNMVNSIIFLLAFAILRTVLAYPSTAAPSNQWTISNMQTRAVVAGNSSALVILESVSTSYRIFFGFYTTDNHGFTLSILLLGSQAPVIWSAKPDNPVSQDVILNFTKEGKPLLKDGDGTMIWSTNTKNNSVACP